jgi:hypothetical protein
VKGGEGRRERRGEERRVSNRKSCVDRRGGKEGRGERRDSPNQRSICVPWATEGVQTRAKKQVPGRPSVSVILRPRFLPPTKNPVRVRLGTI